MAESTAPLPRPPVLLAPAVPDPGLVEDLLVRHAPYWPVQRYIANRSEYAALSGSTTDEPMVVAPVFRGDWAFDGDVRSGVDALLHHEPFVDAARRLFDAEFVEPHTVYVNLTHQLPFAQGNGHTDIPAFRGFDRTTVPVPFLTLMGLSGLFEDVRRKIATAVAWFYDGSDGGFEYWPDGPDAPSVVHEGAIGNTAVVGDNDFMWHRVRPTGRVADGMHTLDLETELVARDGAWAVVRDGTDVVVTDRSQLRISLSWKADVYADATERRMVEDHTGDIDLAGVIERFRADLADRGVSVEIPEDPMRDPGFVDVLRETYVRYPGRSAPTTHMA